MQKDSCGLSEDILPAFTLQDRKPWKASVK